MNTPPTSTPTSVPKRWKFRPCAGVNRLGFLRVFHQWPPRWGGDVYRQACDHCQLEKWELQNRGWVMDGWEQRRAPGYKRRHGHWRWVIIPHESWTRLMGAFARLGQAFAGRILNVPTGGGPLCCGECGRGPQDQYQPVGVDRMPGVWEWRCKDCQYVAGVIERGRALDEREQIDSESESERKKEP